MVIDPGVVGDCSSLQMSKAGAFDLATGVGGKIEKDEVLSAVDKYTLSLQFLLFASFGLKALIDWLGQRDTDLICSVFLSAKVCIFRIKLD